MGSTAPVSGERAQQLAPELALMVEHVCSAEMEALKPGNVHNYAAGHGMSAADFTRSAAAIAQPITRPGISVGERIYAAVAATHAAVGANTNLGIILLCAPLVHAAMAKTAQESLHAALERTLAHLTVADAELAYRAIRLANPGGLGRSERYDVSETPAVSLLDAMQEAAQRDTIALQYVSGYRHIYELALPGLRWAYARWGRVDWALVYCYLTLLTRLPDSLIARKHGYGVARAVGVEAVSLLHALQAASDPKTLIPQLMAWDASLKHKNHNPGTTADLSVATLLVAKLEELLVGRNT